MMQGIKNLISSSSSSSSSSPPPAGMHQAEQNISDLHSTYNANVQSVQSGSRPGHSSSGSSAPFDHHAVEVTANGRTFQVEKGPGYGTEGGDTIVKSSNMQNPNSGWKMEGEKQSVQGANVGDFVKAGGTDYKLPGDTCIQAKDRMMNVGKEDTTSSDAK
ncbi:predicted protein [Naegleria gruberi]|uniref:Predicted protein n=1 Tax=Naegleria gruberi TaxID=5762 RepID=D2VJ91_NAEGR|nr:uncharacterized protein NAEGRDRAFT_49997 [Naegleria gruberi]EFC43153.1 predicted protein [Naegleria gruberi]|eukprot:XP_002675897.1 predicted protein [Naegleria gruberi strain NEG-M]